MDVMTKAKGGGNAIFSFELPSLDWRQEKKRDQLKPGGTRSQRRGWRDLDIIQ